MREVLISIQPRWVKKIVSGEKTVEVRKTRPKCEVPFKCYIYCTKGKPTFTQSAFCDDISNGKVIGEFVCDCITPLYNVCYDEWERLLGGLHRIEKQLVENACLTEKELQGYANGKRCYAWHITDLVVYDEPRELSEFEKPCEEFEFSTVYSPTIMKVRGRPKFIERPPQSWCYIEPRQTAD